MNSISADSEQRLRELINKHELSAVEDLILSHAVECVPLVLGPTDDYSQIGNSRYGGVPDLPPSIPWPTAYGQYLGFLQQINLADLPQIEKNPLPSQGMLYFFLEELQSCYEVKYRLLFHDGNARALQRAEEQSAEQFLDEIQQYYLELQPHVIQCRLGIDLPNYGSDVRTTIVENAGKTRAGEARDRYSSLTDEALGDIGRFHNLGQLLGHACEYGGDLRLHAHFDHIGKRKRMSDYAYLERHKTKLSKIAEEWRLLWQINSNGTVDVMYWDAGSLSVIIRDDDLEKMRLDRVYVELESG